MTTFVLVPGACHGGWWYRPVVDSLTSLGHKARAVTLDGLDPDDRQERVVTLDAHVRQLADLLAVEPEPVVLAGHSYAGSVITGAADAVPEQVRALLYLDAFVPSDGDSCWSMTNDEQREWYVGGAGRTGTGVDPLPFFDERAVPHPLATLVQRSRLTGAWTRVVHRHYALATAPEWIEHSPFIATAERLRDDPDWTVHDLPTRHNVLADGPDILVELLIAVAQA